MFREFCIEHYDEAIQLQPDFINLFFRGLKENKVKIIKKEVVCG